MARLDRNLPDDPAAIIQACVRGRRILWKYHVNLRLQGRFVARRTILDAVDSYEIVEWYPEDKYLPSCLVLALQVGNPMHVLFAMDLSRDNVRVVTVYQPSLNHWEEDWKTRRALP